MFDKKIDGAVVIDRVRVESLLKERQETLKKVEANVANMQSVLNQETQNLIGLRHRINELTELLK